MSTRLIIRIVVISAIFLTGLLAGRWTKKPIDRIEYIPGPTITDTIRIPVPYYVEIPAKPVLPTKPDTIRIPGKEIVIIEKVDTAQIISEYIKRNFYKETLFKNDTTGEMIVSATVQYNRLQSIGYTFTPIIKQIRTERKRVITPFVSSSANTLGFFSAGGGAYINNIGFEVKRVTDFTVSGTEFGVHVKF